MSLYHQRFQPRARTPCPKCFKLVTVHTTTGRLHSHRCQPVSVLESAAAEVQALAEQLERRAAESPRGSSGRETRNEVGRMLAALSLRLLAAARERV